MKTDKDKYRILAVLLCISLLVHAGVAVYAFMWVKPPVFKSPEQRLQAYIQYLPENAKQQYRDRILGQIGEILPLQNDIRQHRKKIADLLLEKNPNKVALEGAFEQIRTIQQQVNSIYQLSLIDTELGLSIDDRKKTHDFIMSAIKAEAAAPQ